MRALSLALISALVVGGCARKSGDARGSEASRAAPASTPAAAGSGAKASLEPTRPVDHRKVIRTGRIELIVASYDDARAKLDAMLAQVGGYVDSTQVDRRQSAVSDATLVIRIPADAYAAMLPKLGELGEVTSETTNAADITDQYVDTTARLASAQQLETRLLELATAHNGNIDQILAVERELARVRGEIEGYQGHLKQWNDQIDLSTLTLSISTRRAEIAAAAAPTIGSRTSEAFHDSIDALRAFGAWLLVHGIAVLPWLLILVPGGVLVRRLARGRARLPAATARPAEPPTAS